MIHQLHALLEGSYEEMVSIRRYLHQHPELSFQETKTAAFISDYYQNLGIECQSNVGGHGVVAKITGSKPGKTVALRADFDALPIQDEKEVSYRSTVPGVMHACGHDGHTATLLVLAKNLHELKDELEGQYIFIHQHAEEYAPGGAKPMIDAGCLDGVDVIFGTHLWATAPTGTVQYTLGPIMAAADRFEILIQGQGGHGAQPHKTRDAIVVGSQLVVALQQIVSRRLNPLDSAVITIGSFVADNAFNVIADKAKIVGTVRTFKEDLRSFISEEIERVVKGTCLAADCTYDYKYFQGYPAVIPHNEETKFLIECTKSVKEVLVAEEIDPDMTGEDFSYYLQKVKGTFFFTGAKPKNDVHTYPHHHPLFDIDEKAMLIAAKTLGTAAVTYHNKYSSTQGE
ncbi:M20 family metallopeptidase [Peribacillus butanolivorans]|uniref:Amidohydrolase n=1 Tax=Peribacillus butanolivorans TaxID=421767 RepID=A0AAX0SA26_9BACI|nr:M20 family metallopeptidase [Peribacillus butanolivorans]AXN40122.1 amidohydrolase [Peribacillus butanolivorans]PEJ36936.1 peptidase M20 [Peribacillus butanolivorans]QNU05987.1 amidohydrolase [Peribacillus butanolivorans]